MRHQADRKDAGLPGKDRWIGFLHPGEMGSALGAVVRGNGLRASWTGAGRTPRTRERARTAGMEEAATLAELCKRCELLVSICPPHAATDVARQVAVHGFRGIFVDANAISPAQAREIGDIVAAAGGGFVDAAIVGPPPIHAATTTMFLCGPSAEAAAACFAGGPLQVEVLGPEIGRASAIKMCHSALHKGQLAMLFATLAAAEKLGVRREVEKLWASRESTAVYLRGMEENLRRASKAWRFAGEMDEAASTLEAAGLPDGFHRAAAEIFRRLSGIQSMPETTDMARMLQALLPGQGPEPPAHRHERNGG